MCNKQKQCSISISKARSLLLEKIRQRDVARMRSVWAKEQFTESRTMEPHGFSDERRDWSTIKGHCERVFTEAVRTTITLEKMVTLYRSIIGKAEEEGATQVILPLELPSELENRNVVAERMRVSA